VEKQSAIIVLPVILFKFDKSLPMSTAELKQKLQQYIETGDEKLLKLMYAVAREYNDEENEYEIDDVEIQMLEERWENYKSGKSKTYSWDEVKESIRKNKKPD
jgi:putative addiction module component (TIGR02574 family)